MMVRQFWLVAWAWIAVFMLAAAAQAQENPASLRAFPAKTLALTDADKAAQRQAGEKLIHDLQAAVAAGAKTFVIPQGDYRFVKAGAGTKEEPAFLAVTGAQNMTIDGSGSTLTFEESNTTFYFTRCANVTLKNVAIDFDPVLFIQGRILATHPDSDEIDVALDADYLDPRSLAMADMPDSLLRGIVFEADTRLFKQGQGNFNVEPFWKNQIGPHTYRTKVRYFHGKTLAQNNVAAGDMIVLWRWDWKGGHVVRLEDCTDMTMEDVTIYGGGFAAFRETGTIKSTTYRRANVLRRPGTNRLFGFNGVGLSTLSSMAGPIVEHCRMEYMGDAFINVRDMYYRLLVQESPTVIITDRMPYTSVPVGPGTQMDFYVNKGFRLLGRRKIVAVEPLDWVAAPGAKMMVADEPEYWWSKAKWIVPPEGSTVPAYRITLDQPLEAAINTFVGCPQYNDPGMIVRDCDFRGTVTRGIWVRSSHVQILNCRFFDTGSGAVGVDGERGHFLLGEALVPDDVLIQGNHISRCCVFPGTREPKAAIIADHPDQRHNAEMPDNPEGWVSNVRIVNNTISECYGEGIRLSSVRQATITGNTISGYNLAPSFSPGPSSTGPDLGRYVGMDHGIVLDHVLGLTLENNTLSQPGPVTQGEYFRLEVTPAP